MASQFLLAIIERDSGQVLSWEPGAPLEADLAAALSDKMLARPVGIATTRAQVAQQAAEALREIIRELKQRV